MKKKIILIWLIIISCILTTYYLFPNLFSVKTLENLKSQYYFLTLGIYIFVLSIRGLTFLPSTPLLFLGIAIFDPILVFIINMIAILISSTTVYYFSSYIGLDKKLEDEYPKQKQKILKKLKNKKTLGIGTWSVSPFVPTDLIVYISSTLNIKLWKVLLGVFVGEAILNAFYIISVSSAINLF